MASSSSRRKGGRRTEEGPLRALGSSSRSRRAPERTADAVDEDSDEEEMEWICSQQSMTERVMAMSNDATGGLSNLPKRKPNSPKSGIASKAQKGKKEDRSRPAPLLASRASERLRYKEKTSYQHLNDSDGSDFEDGPPYSGRKKSRSKKRKRADASKTKHRADSPISCDSPTPKPQGAAQPSSSASNTLVLNIKSIKKRKVGGPSEKTLVKWEVERKQGLLEEEIAIVGIIFREHYSPPVNNARTAARFRVKYGRDPTPAELDELFKANKPWGEKWYRFHNEWTALCRHKKMTKPPDKNPRLTKAEIKSWFKDFVKSHGNIQKSVLPKKYRSKKALEDFYNGISLPDSDDDDDDDFMPSSQIKRKVKNNSNVDDTDTHAARKAPRQNSSSMDPGATVPRRSPRKRVKSSRYREADDDAEDRPSGEEEEGKKNSKANNTNNNNNNNNTTYRIGKKSLQVVDLDDSNESTPSKNEGGNGIPKKKYLESPIDVDVVSNRPYRIPLNFQLKKNNNISIGEKIDNQTSLMQTLGQERKHTADAVSNGKKQHTTVCIDLDDKKSGEIKAGNGQMHNGLGERGVDKNEQNRHLLPLADKGEKSGNDNIREEKVMKGAAGALNNNNEKKKEVSRGDNNGVEKAKIIISKPYRIPKKKNVDENATSNAVTTRNGIPATMDMIHTSKIETRWKDGRIVKRDEMSSRAQTISPPVPALYPSAQSGASDTNGTVINEKRAISQLAAGDDA